jgi:FecR protein
MPTTPRMLIGSAFALLFAIGPVAPAAAQALAAGVVNRVEGTAAVARTATPEATPLKIKDAVYVRDLVTTGEQSRAQLLLGRKATVTIREQSALRITEIPGGTATIDMTDGKLKVAAIKDRLKPGDRIEVRTPTAITAVRGTAWIVEVTKTPAGPVSRITVLDGVVEVTPLDPATGRPRGAVIALRALQQLDVGGATPPAAPQTITTADASRLDATFAFTLKAGAGADPDVLKRQLDRAAKDAAAAQTGSANRLPPGGQDSGPNVSGDAIRSRTGTPMPTPSGGSTRGN